MGEGSIFTAEDFADEVVSVWVENWPSVQFFARLSTQWRHGMNGPTGLDYTAVLSMLRTLRLPRQQADDIFADVQVLERAALMQMRKDAESK